LKTISGETGSTVFTGQFLKTSQDIIGTVLKLLNTNYIEFLARFPDFRGTIGWMGHSLGAAITSDILTNWTISQGFLPMPRFYFSIGEE